MRGLPRAARLDEPLPAQARERLPALHRVPLPDRHRHAGLAAALVPQPVATPLPELHHLSRRGPRVEPRSATAEVSMRTMTMARKLWLFTPLLAFAVTASAQTAPEVEIGYRWLNLSGSSDVYRSQVNERSGILLHSFTFSTTDNALGDYFRLD